MKKSLTIIMVSVVSFVKAQEYIKTVPTQFDTFINQPSIQWAAYTIDSTRFINPNLGILLVSKMGKGEIKATYPIVKGSPEADKIEYRNKEEIDRVFNINVAVYEPLGNLRKIKVSDTIDSLTSNLLFITQVLYVQNGQLKSYIPWVSTAYSRIYSSSWEEPSEYFSTCLNFQYDYINSSQENIFISQTKKKIMIDSIPKPGMLKQLYGKNLLETIWPYIVNGTYSFYTVPGEKKINAEDLRQNKFILDSLERYDSIGNVTGYQNRNAIPFYIDKIELVQDWYYDPKKNIVTSQIPSILLFASKNGVPYAKMSLSQVFRIKFD